MFFFFFFYFMNVLLTSVLFIERIMNKMNMRTNQILYSPIKSISEMRMKFIIFAGQITWDEYHAHFLRKHGFSEHYINSHNKKHVELSRTLKEMIMRDRARWSEAARSDPEKLTVDEFLAFTHPESNVRTLLQSVEEMFDKFGNLNKNITFN